jgi:hypothetical protein
MITSVEPSPVAFIMGERRITRARQSRPSMELLAGLVAAAVALLVSLAGAQSGGGDVVADVVLGQSNFNSNAKGGGPSGLTQPLAVAIDRRAVPNHLYVADSFNNRVLGWSER